MDDIAKFLVRSPKQVFSHFKLLLAERCLISAAFGEGEKDTFITAILEIDEKKQTLTLDCGPREYLNKKLLDSSIIKCSTEYQGIKVQFEGRKIKKAGTAGQPAFSMPLPKSIHWIQRRQYYRVKSPLSKNSFCNLTVQNSETDETTDLKLKLNDLSASGFSLLNNNNEFAEQLLPSTEFSSCKLELENEEHQSITFEICYTIPLNPSFPNKTQRIGCKISNASIKTESTLLRYMQNIERELKQKEK